MTKSTRKFLKIAVAAVLALVVIVVALMILVPAPPDMTAQSKVVVAAVLMGEARSVLQTRCMTHTLKPGMDNVTPGFPETYRPDPDADYVRDINISVQSPTRALITATLGDIYSEWLPFWKTLDIPAGAQLVIEFKCESGRIAFIPHPSTTVLDKYLIDILKPVRAGPHGQAS